MVDLTFEETQALLELIEFHEDWDEVSEQLGLDVEKLYDKLSNSMDAE